MHVVSRLRRASRVAMRRSMSSRQPRDSRSQSRRVGVRWAGSFLVDQTGRFQYTVAAWTDVFGTWRDELERKLQAGQHDLQGELSEGLVLLRAAAERAKTKTDRKLIEHALLTLEDDQVPESAKASTLALLSPHLSSVRHLNCLRKG